MRASLLLLVSFSLLLAREAAAQPWTWRAPLPQGYDLHSVVASPSVTLALGTRGTLLRKSGSGPWERIAAGMPSKRIGYRDHRYYSQAKATWTGSQFLAAGLAGNSLLASEDGRNWRVLPVKPTLGPRVPAYYRKWPFLFNQEIHSQSGVTLGFESGHSETYLRSADEGKTWQRLATPWMLRWEDSGRPDDDPFSEPRRLPAAGKGVFVHLFDTGEFYVSSDGLNWRTANMPFPAPRPDYHVYKNYYHWRAVSVNSSGFLAQGNSIETDETGRSDWRSIWLQSVDGANWVEVPDPPYNGYADLVRSTGGPFVADSGDKVFLSPDGRNWTEVPKTNARGSAFSSAITTTQGETYAVGKGGLIARIGPGSLQHEVQNYIGSENEFFLNNGFAQGAASLFHVTAAGAGNYFLAVERVGVGAGTFDLGEPYRTIESLDGLNFAVRDYSVQPSEWEAVATAKIGSRVIKAEIRRAQDAADLRPIRFSSTEDGRTWQSLGESPFSENFLACLSGKPGGPYLAVLVEVKYGEGQGSFKTQLYRSTDWQTWNPVALPAVQEFGFGWRASTPMSLQWDGLKFLLLGPDGRLHSSADGLAWATLPTLPADTKLPYWSQNPQTLQNYVYSFASNGKTLVARIAKSEEHGGFDGWGDINRFAVFEKGKWRIHKTRGSQSGNHGNVVWTGRAFVAGEIWDGGGVRSSKTGKAWSVQKDGASISQLCWTGTQMVGLTADFGILTHPTGQNSATK